MIMFFRRLTVAVLAVTIFGIAACDDGTDTVATATVDVLAYIDANNSNDNDAADALIEGATVTLSMVGSDAGDLTQTTGADGIATFTAVEIGSYTAGIELPSGLTGVALASASNPTVAVDQEGATVSASFRYTYNPGAITGHVFVGDGAWAEGLPGVPDVDVTIAQGGTDLSTVQTDASGEFFAGGLLPGDYDVSFTVPPYLTAASTSGTVSLAAEDTGTVDFPTAIDPTNTIDQARAAAAGDEVSIVGVALTGLTGDSAALSGSSFYMQDGTAGISIFRDQVEAAIEVGDSVLVYGERGAFRSEVQLSALAILPLGTGTLPAPADLTAAQLNGNELQGQLALLQDAIVDSIPTDGTDPIGEVWISEFTTGEDAVLYVDTDAGIDIAATFTIGSAYDVTGVVARFDDLFELKPRMPSDVAEETSLTTSIRDVRDAATGTPVSTTGVVTEPGTLEGNGFYVRDATAGIFVYTDFGNIPAGLAIGDVVSIDGDRAQFNAIAQIGGGPAIAELRTATTPLVPTPITSVELNSGTFQGDFVTLNEVVVDSVSGSNVYVSDPNGDDALIRLDSDSGVSPGGFVVGNVYSVAGVVSNFGGTEQLKPRFIEDVSGFVPVDTMTTIAEARAADAGTPAVVEGVVTVDHGNFGDEIYIQDSQAGIALFDFSVLDGLVETDSIRVFGVTDAFNGNIQISVDSIQTLGTGTVPSPVLLTGTEVNGGSNAGELANLQSFTVDSVVVVGGFDSHNVFGQSGDGQAVRLFVDDRSGIASADWTVGTEYDIVGIMSFRDPNWRLRPRKPADQTEATP